MSVHTMRGKLDYLVRKTGCREVDILAQAVEEGVSELYRKQVADAYLAGELNRKKALAELGEEYIKDLDYAREAVEADIQWGLQGA
ncbi:MAG: hypothetical protein PHT33_13550 [bacterium]|nr:hypothetical protein [bacterium]